MARKTRIHTRRRSTTARKHCHNHKHKCSKNCKCKCKYCAKKGTRTRTRRGGTQTAVGGDMIYKGGQWYSSNPLGGRS